jgi:hypothetical protein
MLFEFDAAAPARILRRGSRRGHAQTTLVAVLLLGAALVYENPISELSGESHVTQALGGMNLQAYCKKRFGVDVRSIGSNVFDWRCGEREIDMLDVCQDQYGTIAQAAYRNPNDLMSWFCYSTVNRLPPQTPSTIGGGQTR